MSVLMGFPWLENQIAMIVLEILYGISKGPVKSVVINLVLTIFNLRFRRPHGGMRQSYGIFYP